MAQHLRILGLVALVGLFALPASGQTVQLPSYQWFSVNTSVMAPDRGGAYLGGVKRSALGAKQFGRGPLFGNRALGGSSGSSSTSVHVTVIDHEELDRAVLAEARRRRGDIPSGAFAPGVTRLSNQLSDSAASNASQPQEQGLLSVAEIRRLNAQRKKASQDEARRLAAQGWEAEQQGSTGAAKIFYQMAYRRADTELKQQIAPRLKRLVQSDAPDR